MYLRELKEDVRTTEDDLNEVTDSFLLVLLFNER